VIDITTFERTFKQSQLNICLYHFNY